MKPIRILAVGAPEERRLMRVRGALAERFRTSATNAAGRLDPAFAFHPERGQHDSTKLLERIVGLAKEGEILVGVTEVDLFVPVLTFVFGEAQLGGRAAVVSDHRLRPERYGLPADPELVVERLVKEAVHETGHVLGLTHCDDRSCVMASSHAVEWIDLKDAAMCPKCERAARMRPGT